MFYRKWDLQLLADGGDGGTGTGGGEAAGTGTGVNAGDAALPDRLAELGVPRDRIERNRKALERRSAAAKRTQAAAPAQKAQAPKAAEQNAQPTTGDPAQQQTAAQEAQPGQQAEPQAVTRESMLANADMKKIMDDYANEIVRARVKDAGRAAESLRSFGPGADLLAAYYGLDTTNGVDLAELSRKIVDDNTYYEDRAMRNGTTPEEERQKSMQAMQQQQLQEQTMRAQFERLRQQGEVLKQKYPSFDLGTELKNPAFSRMVGPGSLVSVEDAYFAVHRQEILQAQQEAAQKAAMEAASRSIQAGQARPVENGATPTATPAAAVNIRDKSYRDDLKRRIYAAAARGEKIYPGT